TFGNPPVDVDGPPAPFVDPAVQVVGAEGVAPVVERVLPELTNGVAVLLQPRSLQARIAAEDDVVEDVLSDEARAVAQRLRAVAADAFNRVSFTRLVAQEQVAPADDALPRRRGAGRRGVERLALRRLPLAGDGVEHAGDGVVGERLGF